MIDMITLPGIDPKMIANNLTPFEPTHPGELLVDELEAREITVDKFSAETGVELSVVKSIMDCKLPVDTQTALIFEASLGIPSHIWLGLQADYDMQIAKSDKSFMRRLASIRRIAAVL